jgi:hypothetical protein
VNTTINDLSYAEMVDMLDAELTAVAAILKGLSDEEWGRTSPLRPVEEALPHWTVREVASHFDVSIGLTLALIAGQGDLQPARDRTSFFINPRSETAPVVYEYAYRNLADYGQDPIHERVVQTFEQTTRQCRASAPELVGPGYFAPMRLDEFVASRIVEAVVHGIDVTQALGRSPVAGPGAVAFTASILDDLLARRTVGKRPADLADDLEWVHAASGRADHADNRLPLIG